MYSKSHVIETEAGVRQLLGIALLGAGCLMAIGGVSRMVQGLPGDGAEAAGYMIGATLISAALIYVGWSMTKPRRVRRRDDDWHDDLDDDDFDDDDRVRRPRPKDE